jgi:hypothetical protein
MDRYFPYGHSDLILGGGLSIVICSSFNVGLRLDLGTSIMAIDWEEYILWEVQRCIR